MTLGICSQDEKQEVTFQKPLTTQRIVVMVIYPGPIDYRKSTNRVLTLELSSPPLIVLSIS